MASGCVVHDMVRELWIKINKSHHVYLTQENSPLKTKYRNNLQKYIHDFLSIVPHNSKFFFRQTPDIIRQSFQSFKTHNVTKMTNAWLAISLYANNLYLQPWRTEYQEIKMYCGYYKHTVQSYLAGVEEMLELMGYKLDSDDRMIFDGCVDIELVSSVSREAIIALTECQAIFGIYKEISRKFSNCGLIDVLEYRETHTCSIEQAIQGLYCMYYKPVSSFSNGCAKCHSHCASQSCVSYEPCCSICRDSVGKPSQPRNGYRTCYDSTNGVVVPARKERSGFKQCHSYSVPTGKLIDVDDIAADQRYAASHCRSSSSDHCVRSKSIDRQPTGYSVSPRSRRQIYDVDEHDGVYDNWDYVYRGLEYSGRETRIDGPHVKCSPASADDKPVTISEVFSKLKLNADYQEDRKRAQLYHQDTLDSSKSLPAVRNTSKLIYEHQKKSKSADFSQSDSNIATKLGDFVKTWECLTCTYHNPAYRDICEMCGKSRTVGGEKKPLISGGKQCPQCTLVNNRDALNCEACDSSLKDSPTYI